MLNKKIRGLLKFLIIIIMIALVGCSVMQVVFRYVFKISVPWTEEMARLFVVWLTIVGVAVIEGEDAQITTNYFVAKLKIPRQKIWKSVITVLSALYLIAFFIGSLKMVPKTNNLLWGSIPWIKTSAVYIPAIISIPLALIFIYHNYNNFKKFDEM